MGTALGHGRQNNNFRAGRIGVAVAAVMSMAVVVLPSGGSVSAASFVVTTTADTIDAAATCLTVTLASLPGPGGQTSLREAVCAANNTAGDDTISFAVNGTFALTGAANEDNGGSGDLDVKQGLAITGNGTANTIIDGSGIERIFDVFPSAPSTFGLTGLTVQNGDTRTTSFTDGGALYLHNNVTTTLSNVRVQNNFSGSSGAIENRGILTITDSTISGNQTIPASGNVTGGGIRNAGPLTITNSTISNNSVRGEGGGIATTTAAAVTVSVSNTTISGNIASVTGGGLGNGGGISTTGNDGTLNLTNVTISGNSADNNGGGAYFVTPGGSTGNVNLNNVTIAANVADADNANGGTGGGISQNTSVVTLRNTLVATNTNSIPSVRDDISGTVAAASANNLVGDGTGLAGITNGVNGNLVGSGATPIDPMIGVLAANGGSTNTHALLASSPAINTGNAGTCAPLDQRGTARAGVCDIGAYELNDAIPPDTTLTVVPPNPSNSTTASLSFTGSDTGGSGLAGFECALDSLTFTTCTSPGVYSGLSNGSHTFQVRAVDGVGNIDPTPASYTWSIDSIAPETTIDTNPTNPSTSTTANFTFSGTDVGGSGVASFECRLGVAAFAPCTSPLAYTALADGSHTFEVRAIDAAGNTDATPASFTWIIDATPPDTTITSSPTNPSASANATLMFTGADPGGGTVVSFECQLDGGGFAACTSPQAYTALADGSHTFEVRAIDNEGNIDPTPAAFTWLVDTTAPTTTTTENPASPSASGDASFSFTGGDAGGSGVVSFECKLDTGDFAACTSPRSYAALADGSHTFQVRAIDAAGNVDSTPALFTWSIDTVVPSTTITSGPPASTTATSATFTFTGTEPTPSFECSLDGAAFQSCTSPHVLSGLSVGSHTFRVRAVDAAGNVDATPASLSWAVTAVPVTAAPTTTNLTGTPLPDTGASHTQDWLLVGLLFAGSGAMLLAVRRRRINA
jgi:LPXTG-motif cell wall-anchored protein